MYNIVEDQWTYIPDPRIGHSYLSTVIQCDTKLYIIGGEDYEDDDDQPTNALSCLDMNSNVLSKCAELPFAIHGYCGSLLLVPRE